MLTASPCSPLCSLVHSETAAKFTKGTSSITSTNKRHRHTRRLRTNRTPKIAYHTNTGWMSTLDELGRRSRPCITKRFRKPASKPNHHCKIVKVCTHRIFFFVCWTATPSTYKHTAVWLCVKFHLCMHVQCPSGQTREVEALAHATRRMHILCVHPDASCSNHIVKATTNQHNTPVASSTPNARTTI